MSPLQNTQNLGTPLRPNTLNGQRLIGLGDVQITNPPSGDAVLDDSGSFDGDKAKAAQTIFLIKHPIRQKDFKHLNYRLRPIA